MAPSYRCGSPAGAPPTTGDGARRSKATAQGGGDGTTSRASIVDVRAATAHGAARTAARPCPAACLAPTRCAAGATTIGVAATSTAAPKAVTPPSPSTTSPPTRALPRSKGPLASRTPDAAPGTSPVREGAPSTDGPLTTESPAPTMDDATVSKVKNDPHLVSTLHGEKCDASCFAVSHPLSSVTVPVTTPVPTPVEGTVGTGSGSAPAVPTTAPYGALPSKATRRNAPTR